MNRRYVKNPTYVFCFLSVISLISLFLVFFTTRGKALTHFFFYSDMDTGMDFFHSIEYVRGRWPYTIFSTIYPPLANLFFLILYAFIPETVTENWTYDFTESVNMRRTSLDLRTYQSCLLMYILFIALLVFFIIVTINRYGQKVNMKCPELVGLGFVFSYGSLYAMERGNIIILAAAFSLFFVCFYHSENKVLRELALISLAIAAGLKVYPAFLGILLLKDRDIRVIVRTVIYGIAAFVLPCFAFREGLSAIPLWLECLSTFSTDITEPWFGYGIGNAVAEAAHILDILFGSNLAYISYDVAGYVIAILFLVMALLMKKSWASALTVTFAMLFQAQYEYFFCMALVPLILFLGEEKSFCKTNVIPFPVMMCMVLPFPLLYTRDEFYPRATLIHIAMAIYFIWCIVSTAQEVKESKHNE